MSAVGRAAAPAPAHAVCVCAPAPAPAATAAARGGPAGALIRGPSGAGKSSLALRLIARGARLVAEDQAALRAEDGAVWAEPTEAAAAGGPLCGVIEARGVGLLRVPSAPRARIALVVDLTGAPSERLPEPASTSLCGVALPLLRGEDGALFADIVFTLLCGGAILSAEEAEQSAQPRGRGRSVD